MNFENEENLCLFPQYVFENMMMMIMMTSLLADKSVTMKIRIISNLMNEIINPPCNSSLATFFHQFVDYVRRQSDLPCGS